MQALTSHIGGAKSLKKNERACMFIWVMRVNYVNYYWAILTLSSIGTWYMQVYIVQNIPMR